jgi:RNA polymerase sigma factor (TIGR02999 family)
MRAMNDVTRILSRIESGDSTAAEHLLPLVYDELRKLAAARLAQEKPGQTLQATALVHEAYVRLVDVKEQQQWTNRYHFFAAAAEAMRRILVERSRQKARVKHGGEARRVNANMEFVPDPVDPAEVIAVDEALKELQQHDQQLATLVKLRYFAGMGHAEAAEAMGISRRVADRLWALARAWLYQKLSEH